MHLVRTDRNGTEYWADNKCPKCGGSGWLDAYWMIEGGRCFKCGGSGFFTTITKRYTEEYAQKLEERRKAREAKKKAEEEAKSRQWEIDHAEEIAKEKAEKEAKRKALEESRARSQYFGNVGDKIERTLKCVYHNRFENQYGWRKVDVFMYVFKDEEGNTFTWNAYDNQMISREEIVTLKGTIKAHKEYNGEKQTVLTRCKVLEPLEEKVA